MRAREVYVSGFGLVAPMALDAATLFERICRKQSCVREHPRFKGLGFNNSAAGFIDDTQWQRIGAGFGGNAALHPRQSVLAEYVARQALEHAGLTPADFAHSRSGLFLGANKYCADSHDLRPQPVHG